MSEGKKVSINAAELARLKGIEKAFLGDYSYFLEQMTADRSAAIELQRLKAGGHTAWMAYENELLRDALETVKKDLQYSRHRFGVLLARVTPDHLSLEQIEDKANQWRQLTDSKYRHFSWVIKSLEDQLRAYLDKCRKNGRQPARSIIDRNNEYRRILVEYDDTVRQYNYLLWRRARKLKEQLVLPGDPAAMPQHGLLPSERENFEATEKAWQRIVSELQEINNL